MCDNSENLRCTKWRSFQPGGKRKLTYRRLHTHHLLFTGLEVYVLINIITKIANIPAKRKHKRQM